MINLLPPEERKELLAEEIKRLAITLGLIVLLSLLCLTIILGFLKVYLLIQIDLQKNVLESIKEKGEDSEARIIEEKIDNSNQKLAKINDFYEQKYGLENILEKLIQAVPKEIYLTNLFYSKTSSQIILAGFSPSRDLLVQFKKNLEQKEEFRAIYFPPSNWIEPVDIDFAGVKINFGQ